MNADILHRVREKLINNDESITFEEARELSLIRNKEQLLETIFLSNKVTDKYHASGIYLCSIISARTGACPEDCSFCSQSIYSELPLQSQTFIEPEKILESATKLHTVLLYKPCRSKTVFVSVCATYPGEIASRGLKIVIVWTRLRIIDS